MLTRGKIVLAIPLLGLALLALIWGRGDWDERPAAVLTDASVTIGFHDRAERPRLAPAVGAGAFSLSGHLRGADGAPVAGASITATTEIDSEEAAFGDAGMAPAIVANTALDGSFTLQGTGTGSYHLRIEGEMLVTAEVRFVDSPGPELELLVARSVTVSGRVHEGTKGRAEVRVFLQGETSPGILETSSASNGEFSFSAAEGAFRIWAQAPALAARVQRVERFGVGPFGELSLPLETAYTFSGRVVEAGGSELGVSADVTLRSESGMEAEHHVQALRDGAFAIDAVLAGRWIAEARAAGFVATIAPSVDVQTAPFVRIVLDRGGRITGQVVGPDGQALVGAELRLVGKRSDGSEVEYSSRIMTRSVGFTVHAGQRLLPMGELGVLLGPIPLVPPPSGNSVRIATPLADSDQRPEAAASWPDPNRFVSDADGNFTIAGVVPGHYRLVASHQAYAETTSGAIAVRGSAKLPKIRLRMLAGTRLFGKIRDQAGLAITGATVFVRFEDGREQVLTVSDEDGHYEFPALRGTATIVVEAVGHERGTLRRRLEGKGSGATSTELDLRLARADSYVEARVVDATGFAVRAAIIEVEASEKLLPTAATRSDENGIFRIEGLPLGEHWVSVRHADYPETRVKLATGQAADLVLPYGGGLSVSLRDGQSQASIAMATLTIIQLPDAGTLQAISDERGQALLLAMTPGRYLLGVEAVGYGAQREEFSIEAGERVGEANKHLLIELSRGAVLAGILRDSRGDRVVDATLRVGSVQCLSDAEGRFRLENVPSGRVSVEIEKASLRQVEHVQVQAGEERLTMELVFSPELQIEEDNDTLGQADDEEEGDGDDAN